MDTSQRNKSVPWARALWLVVGLGLAAVALPDVAAAQERCETASVPGLGWGRPYVMLKGAFGIPDIFSARVEAYIPYTPVTLEVGFSVPGLLGHTLSTAIKWRPSATCWGCSGRHMFSMGFGVEGDFIFASPTKTGILIAAALDMHYIFRVVEHFGFMVGLLAGFGPGWDHDSGGTQSGPLKVEPAGFGRVYAGVSF